MHGWNFRSDEGRADAAAVATGSSLLPILTALGVRYFILHVSYMSILKSKLSSREYGYVGDIIWIEP